MAKSLFNGTSPTTLKLIEHSSDGLPTPDVRLLRIKTRASQYGTFAFIIKLYAIQSGEYRKASNFIMTVHMHQDINIWRRVAVITAIFFFTVGTLGALWWATGHWGYRGNGAVSGSISRGPVPPEPELQLYKPLLPEQAILENDQLPFSNAPIESATPLVLPPSQLLPIGRRNAIDCLTSAIYYEAGNETTQGKRAVAQVILNRVRHPAFPKSICGVVYQGSERSTGCQFTFTCDGSLARRPARDRWDQARMIAIGAISGAVEPSVGMATHYHANYVMPYWAPSLNKISQIGTHIFYRWKGSWGRRQAFSQVIELDEESPQMTAIDEALVDTNEELTLPDVPLTVPSRIIADDNLPITPIGQDATPKTGSVAPTIRADQARPTLTADEQKSTLKNN